MWHWGWTRWGCERKSYSHRLSSGVNILLFVQLENHFFGLAASRQRNQPMIISMGKLCLEIPVFQWKPHLDWCFQCREIAKKNTFCHLASKQVSFHDNSKNTQRRDFRFFAFGRCCVIDLLYSLWSHEMLPVRHRKQKSADFG